MMRWFQRHLRFCSLALLLALGAQGVAAASLSFSPSPSSGHGDFPIVICTPAGMMVLPADYLFDDNGDTTDIIAQSPQHCIFCAAAHAVPALLAFSFFFLPSDTQAPSYPAAGREVFLPDDDAWMRLPVRAPPLAS